MNSHDRPAARERMPKERMAAFSDGVIAIIITIMVLELKVPHGETLAAMRPLLPVFLSYVLSFVNVGIYWNNHHHLLHACHRVSAGILWANLHLLFWLSLVPFATAWMGESHFATIPVALYGIPLLMSGAAYSVLCATLIRENGKDSALARVLSRDWKARVSMVAYVAAIPLAFVHSAISLTLYIATASLWLIPDTRLEKYLKSN